jgi:uncharacterized protein (DUF885 family)
VGESTATEALPTSTPEVIGEQVPQPSYEEVIQSLEGLPIEDFFNASYIHLLYRDPEYLTESGIGEFLGFRNDRLNNLTDEYVRETQAIQTEILRILHTYDRQSYDADTQLSIDVYEWYLDDLIRGHEFMYHNYLVHHFLGSYHEELIRLFTELSPIDTKADAVDYIARLSQVDDQMEQVIERMELSRAAGVIPPWFIIEMTISDINRFLNVRFNAPSQVDYSSLSVFKIFAEKVEAIPDLSVEEKADLLNEALSTVRRSISSPFLDLIDYLEQLQRDAVMDSGVWKFPNGEAYYNYIIHNQTQTDMTPEEIHELGLSEVERIKEEMRDIFESLGYPSSDDFGMLMSRASRDGGLFDLSTPELKDAYITEIEATLDDVNQRLDSVFDLRPSADVIIFPDPLFGGFYVPSSFDGTRPGAYHAFVGTDALTRYNMPTVAYHETNPGHHWQIAIAQDLDLPIFRNDSFFNGYGEGWALYAEFLVSELGVYDEDPYGNLGRLQFELLRAVRLVTDTGIHALQWGREEAKDYMDQTLGGQPGRFSYEVDRYIVRPAQALGYKLGMLKILELRQRAMDALGDQFDIKEFHRIVLGNGSLPLEILEDVVDDYIQSQL